MTTEQKLTLAREALEYYARAPWSKPGDVNADNGRIARAALTKINATESAPDAMHFNKEFSEWLPGEVQATPVKPVSEEWLEACGERAASAPAAGAVSIDTPEFQALAVDWGRHIMFANLAAPQPKAAWQTLIARINSYAAQQREEGRQEGIKGQEALNRMTIDATIARAEKAEFELEEWRFTNKIDELRRAHDTLLVQAQTAESALRESGFELCSGEWLHCDDWSAENNPDTKKAEAALAQRTEPLPADQRARIRAILLANGYTIKTGETDLKPYVYAAAQALIDAHETHLMLSYAPLMDAARAKHRIASLEAQLAARAVGGVDGWRLVPLEPTEEMLKVDFMEYTVQSGLSYRANRLTCWKAMLSAAPLPQQVAPEPVCCNGNCNQGRDCPLRKGGAS